MEESPAGRHVEDNGQTSFDRRFAQLVDAIRSARSPNEIMDGLRSRVLSVYEVEMASIFLVDAVKMQLVSWVLLPGNALHKIRVPIDKTSIAGYAAATRSGVIVHDAYDKDELQQIDPKLQFDSFWDNKAGSRTRQVLALPILFQRSLMGVIQLMNRRDGRVFTAGDARHISELAEVLGMAFHNLQRPA
jgi:GAF domain-containing protein